MNVPKLRFPEFSGEWEEKKLSEFMTRLTRKNTNNESSRALTISSVDGLIDQGEFFKKQVASKDISGYYLLKKGDFAYNKSYSVGYDYGSIKRLDRYENGVVSTLYICMTLNEGINSDYLTHYFDSMKWNKSVSEISAEGARNHGLLNIPTDAFFETKHYLSPSLPEQQKIADFLSTVDSIIASETKILNALQKKKKALMQKLFSQQIRFKADDGSEFPEWVEKKLGEVCDVRDGTHDSPKYQSKGYPFITTKNLVGGRIDYSTASLISKDDYEQFDKRSHVDDGDILMPMIGTIGGAVIVKKECDFAIKNVALIKNNENIVLTFFLYQFLFSNNIVYQFHLEKKGGTQQFIALDTIRKLKIVVPTKEEQQKIADCLSSLDNLIQNQQKIVKNWQQRKRGLLQGMFI